MDILTSENLRELTTMPGEKCVSIYMPTTPVGREAQQGSIRLTNLLKEVHEKLLEGGLRTPDILKILEPAKALISAKEFWQYQSDGLALFLSSEGMHYYRLPISFEELVVISERFHIKPLLPMFSGDGLFYVLALSQNAVRLLQGTRDKFTEIELKGIPTSMDEALQFDDPERQLQYHTGSSSPGGGAGKRAAIYHGQGVGIDDEKPNLLRYFRKVNEGLHTLLHDQNAPLVLAGVEYLQPIYKEANEYPHLMDEGIEGSPDRWNARELHDEGWKIVAPLFVRSQQDARDRYKHFFDAKNGRATNKLGKIVPAALGGQVETLFVVVNIQKWGRVDLETNSIHVHDIPEAQDEDLLDFAAVQTILNRGTVYALKEEEMPDASPISAILRY